MLLGQLKMLVWACMHESKVFTITRLLYDGIRSKST